MGAGPSVGPWVGDGVHWSVVPAAEGFGADDAAQMVLGEAAAPSNPSAAARKKRFDKINVELKDGVLRVEGEKRVSQMADGLGGEFTYCTLGEPLSIEQVKGLIVPARNNWLSAMRGQLIDSGEI